MPSGVAQRPLAVAQAPLPDVLVGNHHTKSSALHNIHFVGTISPWTNFENDVHSFCAGINWAQYTHVLTYKGKTSKPWNLDQDQTDTGDEAALQGKFRAHLGEPVTAICTVTGRHAQVTDFRATDVVPIDRSTPDLAIKVGDTLAGVGKAKVFWVRDHHLGHASGKILHLRHVLGQIALYMKIYKVKCGFHTTYKETIFLKQERTSSGWVLYYSDPIQHDAIGDRSNGTVSLRECFLYLVDEAIKSPVADNNELQWVSPDRH